MEIDSILFYHFSIKHNNIHNMKMDLKEIQCEGRDVIEQIQIRVQWQTSVNA
jgi:hypothetical protein